MAALPDDALVVRGGMNTPANFAEGTGVKIGDDGLLKNVSVNCAAGASIETLLVADPNSGFSGVLHGKYGVTTVGKIRAVGGDVVPSPSTKNPYHATLKGLTPEKASELFQPIVRNPFRKKNRRGPR